METKKIESIKERMERREKESVKTTDDMQRIMREADIKSKWGHYVDLEREKDNLSTFTFDSLSQNADIALERRRIESQALKEGLVWVDPWFSESIPFVMDQLYLIGAKSKNGKSTFAANIAYTLWQQGKKVLIISNEESTTDALSRVACLHLGLNFNDDKFDRLSPQERQQIDTTILEAAQFVHIIGKDQTKTYYYEVVTGIMDRAADQDYGAILVDYYQNVSQSIKSPNLNEYEVQKLFSLFAESYIKRVRCPLVVFAQLFPTKKESVDFKSRIEGRKVIYNAATQIFELVKDPKSKCSLLKVVDSRFAGDIEVFCFKFHKGRFVRISEDDYLAEEAKGQAGAILNTAAEEDQT